MDIPKQIYLQHGGDEWEFDKKTIPDEGVTWSCDNEFGNDIAYVLASDYEALRAEVARLREVLAEILYEIIWLHQKLKRIARLASEAIPQEDQG